MYQQLSLFESLNINDDDGYFQQNIHESGFDYQEVDLGDITLKAGLAESIYRWYRYASGLFLIH